MSIDIITLAASKNYTDKQIEKASIGGADVSQNADWNAAKDEPGYILNRPMEVSRANSINFPQFTLDNPQVGVYKVHDIPNITSETQHNYEHDIHFNSTGLRYNFYRCLKSKYGSNKALDNASFLKRENVHMIGGINYYIAFSTFYNVYFIIDVENLNAEYVTKFSDKGIYIEILVDLTAKGYDVSYNIETYSYTKLDPKFLPKSEAVTYWVYGELSGSKFYASNPAATNSNARVVEWDEFLNAYESGVVRVRFTNNNASGTVLGYYPSGSYQCIVSVGSKGTISGVTTSYKA